ncbi:hypothetical protein, conserved [Eimeria brunetti]|uniref:K Homology domain-containing protein n=1 Tax=Eimeria brunetti TaxID=51314 RepID=U6L6W3_9EIME|nr:hypothetical protein, conserved [Eimeria brunetti]
MDVFKRRQGEGPQGAAAAAAAAAALAPLGGGVMGALPGPLSSSNGSGGPLPVYGGPKRQRLGPGGPPGSLSMEGDSELGGPPGSGAPGGSLEGTGGGGAPPRVLPVCLLVSDNIAGALIGKGGATVRELERTTGARIFVQRNGLGPLELAAAKQALLDAQGAPPGGPPVPGSHPSHSGRAAAVLLVPQRSVGAIVGQRGRAIEELSSKTQTQVRVVGGPAVPSGDRALCITAQQEQQVAAAVQLLLQQLQQMLATGRLLKQDFEYLIALASTAQPKAMRGGAPPRAGAPGMGAGGPLPGGPLPGGPLPGGPLALGGASPSAGGPGAAAGGPGGYRFVASVEACGGLHCSSVLCFVIPQRLAAWVVGPQGAHVRAVREETGAQVQVLDEVSGFTGEDASSSSSSGSGSSSSSSSSSGKQQLSPREQHRIISVEGPTAARLVALALIWQRILGVEYPELYREGAPFICPSSLAEDLQQQGYDTSKVMLPPAPARLQQQQQQQPYGGPEGGAPYYDGPSAAGAGGGPWGGPQGGDPMGGGPQQRPWGHDDAAAAAAAGWGGAPHHEGGAPSMDQVEACLRSFCCRVGPLQDMGALAAERQTIRLLLSIEQGELLLRRDPISNGSSRFGGGPPAAAGGAPNALDRISEVTGCHVRCFTSSGGPPNGGPQQQQMVLVFTGSAAANSIAVMLTQARLLQP